MVTKKDDPLDWESWQAEFSKAARAWEPLASGSTHVGVADGTIYLVRGPAGTDAELAALGWEFSADGARSMHPTPNTKSALAKASLRLLTVSRRLPSLADIVEKELARHLGLAVEALITQLDGQPDPATQQQRDAVRKVDDRLLDIRSAAAHQRAVAAEAARKLDDERRQARLLAEELQKLQRPTAEPPTTADLALQERRARQLRVADTAFGRDALQLLSATHEQAPGAWRQLAAFNGCGGQRWDKTARVKECGKGYDHARRALAEMVECGLVERAGAGESRRGGFRITAEGLQLRACPSLVMAEPRKAPKDHILPESYLRRFLGQDRAPGGDSLLQVYSHRTRQWDAVRPRETYIRPGFMDLKDKAGNQSRILDKWLKKLESKAAPFFPAGGFVHDQRHPTAVNRVELAAFVAQLEIRNPTLHEALDSLVQQVLAKVADMTHERFRDDPLGWQQHLREFESATGKSAAGLKPEDLDPSGLKFTVNRTFILMEVAKTFKSLTQEHARARWRLLVAPDPMSFITSDKPVMRVTHFTSRGPGFLVEHLRRSDLLAVIPLSRSFALAEVAAPSPAWDCAPASLDLVAAVNQEVFRAANEFVFAGKRSFVGHEACR